MFLGRTEELAALNESYNSGKNTLTVLYGRTGIGKTELIKEFIKDKNCVYYVAPQSSSSQQEEIMVESLGVQLEDEQISEMALPMGVDAPKGYDELLPYIYNIKAPVKLLIVEEFQNIVKQNKGFMDSIKKLVEGEYDGQYGTGQVMVVCTSSSISWIENSLVATIGTNALAINSFIKLKELSFVDTVRFYKRYSVPDAMLLYAITGGVPGYMSEFSDTVSIRDNICNNMLAKGKKMRDEGSEYIKEELRETALYNTILSYIARGADKLNELHALTGFGRDKISVYLKNLIEREVVEKIYSYDTSGNEHTRKGLYRIKSGFTEFWFKYVYGREAQLELLGEQGFYDKYIADSISEYAKETFVKVGTEFVELMDSMDRLPVKIDRRGRWWGKNGDIDIIACDINKKYVIGKCNWLTDVFTFTMFEELVYNVNLAGIGRDYIYLFSKGTFDDELVAYARENSNINLISLNDL